MAGSAAHQWFGPDYVRLHPLLQQLHRNGATLDGMVDVRTGKGIGGWLGRRLAARLGVPLDAARCRFQVRIAHHRSHMLWARRFTLADGTVRAMDSTFTPHGSYPDGYWAETTGALRLRLGVDILPEGRWRVKQARLCGIALPLILLPQSQASKHIEDGRYRFEVKFALPGIGLLLSYGGVLTAAFAGPADTQCP